MIVTICLCFFLHFAKGTPHITVFADVFKDRDFFTSTFPWVIDNIGGEVIVDFHLVGSGRYSVHQMCALKELDMNTFLQAQYLKCEAEDYPSAFCVCETGIDPQVFRECVQNGGKLASAAANKFATLKIDTTPVIELGPMSTVFGVNAGWFLKKICTLFGDQPPMGCVKPFACCKNKTELFPQKRALARFDKDCSSLLNEVSNFCGTTTTATTTPTTTTEVSK